LQSNYDCWETIEIIFEKTSPKNNTIRFSREFDMKRKNTSTAMFIISHLQCDIHSQSFCGLLNFWPPFSNFWRAPGSLKTQAVEPFVLSNFSKYICHALKVASKESLFLRLLIDSMCFLRCQAKQLINKFYKAMTNLYKTVYRMKFSR